MPSSKSNALYNSSYQLIRLIFPIITYPYVARVIGPTGIGQVTYAQTIAHYFVIVALLGIPMYGIREVSNSRRDETVLRKTFSELFLLSTGLVIIAFGIYALLPVVLPSVAALPALHWAFGATVLVSSARLDWYYQGLEKYRYVTIRNLLVRIATLGLIFVLVRDSDDYVAYGLIWVGGTVIANLWNFAYSLKLTGFSLRDIHPLGHLKGVLPSAWLQLAGTLHASVDTVMLGILLDDERYSVGLYSTAGRIMRILLSIVMAGGAVLLPKVSMKNASGDDEAVARLIRKNVAFTLYFALPMVIGLIVTAEDAIVLFAGVHFRPAITTARLLAPQLLVLGLANIVNMQIFYARGREKQLLWISTGSIVAAIGLNALLIPTMKQNGAAIATLIVTALGLGTQSLYDIGFVKRAILTRDNGKLLLSAAVWTAPVVVVLTYLGNTASYVRFPLVVLAGALLYAVVTFLFRLEPGLELFAWLRGKLFKRRT